MSDETKKALEKAQTAAAEAERQVKDQARAFLAEIAAGVPTRLEDFAKAFSKSEPDAAIMGGIERLTRLRAELAEIGEHWTESLPNSVDKINWEIYLGSAKRATRAILQPLEPLAKETNRALTEFGFTGRTKTSSRSWGGLLNTESFIGTTEMSVLEPVLQAWVDALNALKKAETADAASQVDAFWS